jgi:CDP-diacylglycerol--glycerol-3-phosphate 3-phosphatidyltransferase
LAYPSAPGGGVTEARRPQASHVCILGSGPAMIEGLKPLYERALLPGVHLCNRLGVKPNHLTVLGVALFGAAGWYCAEGRWYTAAAFVTVGALLDGCDGLLARVSGRKTDFGGILDSTCDRLTEIAWLTGLFVYYLGYVDQDALPVYLCLAALTGSLMVSYVKARCEGQGVECRAGILQRPERIIVLGVCLLLGREVMVYGLAAVAALSWVTVGQRIGIARVNARRKSQG